MGQKIHPVGFRLKAIRGWQSRWYAPKGEYAKLLHEDLRIRQYIKDKFYHTGISRVEIERAAKRIRVHVFTARPGIIIGKKGADIEALKKELTQLTGKDVYINIREIKRPELDAQLVAESVAQQLERRVAFRRAMKKTVTNTMRFGAQGIKIHVAGRLGGAEMARREWYREGRVPLQTIRADIDYGFARALTTYGVIGVKVWLFKGEVLTSEEAESPLNA
ncbi:MAG: 30S ribosomal protein S3 [Nitrospirota bacterium]